MVDVNNREILERILELTDTACQASLELLELYNDRKTQPVEVLLDDLRSVIRAVVSAQEPLLSQLEYAYTSEMLENIEDTIEDIERSIQANDRNRAAMKMEFQLFPFLRQLRESFYFWGTIYPDKAAMERYYGEEFAEHYRNLYAARGDDSAQFQLSIVVPAYNHLETTRRCVEQILKETNIKQLNAELILIDHGSTDGTLEYFESLGIGKVIHFKNNVRMYMFTTAFQICQGSYFAYISNDILVTRNWAEILLQCLKSDEKIIAAGPATPNISNLQMLSVPTDNPEKFVAWANEKNRSNPDLWSDRARLMPPIGMYQTTGVNEIGFADPYFYTMEFWDDDFSLRARRNGYRQILCSDMACYHFGSVTSNAAKQRENTIEYGRELFKLKNGIDAWGNGFCYDYYGIHLLKKALPAKADVAILGLDCGMGDTPLQIKNELRQRHQNGHIFQLAEQKEYLLDLVAQSETAHVVPRLVDGLMDEFSGLEFSCAFLGRDAGQYEDLSQLLQAISFRLETGGSLVFSCENPFFALSIHSILHFFLPEGRKRHVLVDIDWTRKEAEKYFSQVQVVEFEQELKGIEEFAAQYFYSEEQAAQRMKIQRYYFFCRK